MIVGVFNLRFHEIDEIRFNSFANHFISTSSNFISKSHRIAGLNLCFYQNQRLSLQKNHAFYHEDDLTVFLSGHIFDDSITDSSKSLFEIYSNDGIDAICQLEGEFIIGIFDNKKKKAYLIRDHIGCVPLAYIYKDEEVYFASDTVLLCQYFQGEDDINPEYIKSRFNIYASTYNYLPNPNTYKLLPGNYLELLSKKLTEYWNPQNGNPIKSKSKDEVNQRIEELVSRSVKARANLEGCSAHISGGLDSTLIAKLLSDINSGINLYSWSPSELYPDIHLPFDERDSIKEVAKNIKGKVYFADTHLEEIKNYLNNWQFPSEYHYESQVASKVVSNNDYIIFSGFGGDEFLGLPNIPLYRELFWKFRWSSLFKLLKSNEGGILKSFYNNVLFPARRRPSYRLRTSEKIAKYLKNYDNVLRKTSSPFRNKNAYFNEMRRYLHLPERMDDWYVHGHYCGYEYRYPLLSKALLEYVYQLDCKYFIGNYNDRQLIRFLANLHLPKDIVELKKNADPYREYEMNLAWNQFISSFSLDSDQLDVLKEQIDSDKLKVDLSNFSKQEINQNLKGLLILVEKTRLFIKGYSNSVK